MLKTKGDENKNFEPPVLVFKALLPDQSLDEIIFPFAIISGNEIFKMSAGAITVELCPGYCSTWLHVHR